MKPKDHERDIRDERGMSNNPQEMDDFLHSIHSSSCFLADRYRGRDERYSDYDHNKLRRDRKKERPGKGSERDYAAGYYHPSMSQYGYDPHSLSDYYQNKQYYETLRIENPIAYAEWYNHFFAGQLTAAASSVATAARERDGRESGRESVHSGRSSTKDIDR